MPFHIQTDHQVIAHGTDVMRLYDARGTVIATAERAKKGWHVTTDSTGEVVVDRPAAITAMTEHALTHLGPSDDNGEGYSTLVPYGLADLP